MTMVKLPEAIRIAEGRHKSKGDRQNDDKF
jgi:hypothetical protein